MSQQEHTVTLRVRAVLFDLDGTLVDTEALSDRAIFLALQDYLDPAVWDRITGTVSRLPWELKRRLLGLRGSDWGPMVLDYAAAHWGLPCDRAPTVPQLWAAWEAHLNALCSRVEACPGASELVERLAQLRIPLAVATSSRLAAVQEKAKNHPRMFSRIDCIVAGDDPAVANGKPAPDIYLEAAQRLGVDPRECLVVEDALTGVWSGRAAGCAVVAVPDPRFTAEEGRQFESSADVVLKDLNHFDGTLFGLDIKMPGCL